MNDTYQFLSVVGLTLLGCFAVVVYMKRPLRAILVELCGSLERANFWMAFSNVSLILTPLIFAIHGRPDPEERALFIFELGTQLEYALIGLVLTVLVLGVVIGSFIPSRRSVAATERAA